MNDELKVAELFCRRSKHGFQMDPQLDLAEVSKATGLSRDEALSILHRLASRGAIGMRGPSPRSGGPADDDATNFFAVPKTFALFDSEFMGWNPAQDAQMIAASVPAQPGRFLHVEDFIREKAWTIRRVNPALAILLATGRFKAAEAYMGDGLIWKSIYRT